MLAVSFQRNERFQLAKYYCDALVRFSSNFTFWLWNLDYNVCFSYEQHDPK